MLPATRGGMATDGAPHCSHIRHHLGDRIGTAAIREDRNETLQVDVSIEDRVVVPRQHSRNSLLCQKRTSYHGSARSMGSTGGYFFTSASRSVMTSVMLPKSNRRVRHRSVPTGRSPGPEDTERNRAVASAQEARIPCQRRSKTDPLLVLGIG
jgi:hypothetical protein